MGWRSSAWSHAANQWRADCKHLMVLTASVCPLGNGHGFQHCGSKCMFCTKCALHDDSNSSSLLSWAGEALLCSALLISRGSNICFGQHLRLGSLGRQRHGSQHCGGRCLCRGNVAVSSDSNRSTLLGWHGEALPLIGGKSPRLVSNCSRAAIHHSEKWCGSRHDGCKYNFRDNVAVCCNSNRGWLRSWQGDVLLVSNATCWPVGACGHTCALRLRTTFAVSAARRDSALSNLRITCTSNDIE